MRIVVIGLAILAAGTALGIAAVRSTARAIDRSVRGLDQAIRSAADSVTFREEPVDTWPPILWRTDTVGRVLSIARLGFGSGTDRTALVYHAVLTGHPPPYQPDSLAAIDPMEHGQFTHRLRLIPLHTLDTTSHRIGILQFEATTEAIPVLADAAAAPR